MTAATQLIDEKVRFARGIHPQTNACLQEAAASPQADRAEALLNKAARLSPSLLAVDVARYKFYFYRGQLDQAEQVTLDTLSKAAQQGGFEPDWIQARLPLEGRWQPESPERYYLYGLKALAFIRLRRGDREQARLILQALSRMDPEDLVGGSVIQSLLDGSEA
jgi:tetratricopeptide (TPR) repeat protein